MGLKVGYMRVADLCSHPVRGLSASPRPEDLSPAVVTSQISNRKKILGVQSWAGAGGSDSVPKGPYTQGLPCSSGASLSVPGDEASEYLERDAG